MSAVTEQTVAQFVSQVSGQQHAMAGAVIAASAAQAAALGHACLQMSREERFLTDSAILQQIARMGAIKRELLDWCDRDARAIAEFVALRSAGKLLAGQRLLCDAPATVGRLSVEAAQILESFRPLVIERVRDDMEMSIRLLAGTAHAALLLLDSNLRIWPEPALLAEFEPIIAGLLAQVDALQPVNRIRSDPKGF